jgi:ABC-2 type transport system ATP-binding protein
MDAGLAVEAIGVTKRFAPRRDWWRPLRQQSDKLVLEDVSVSVEPGEIFGLIGPNGAGKTTLIKILCGIILQTSGVARVAGYDVVRQEQEVRQRIGLVYGDARSFFWRLTLRENLRFYAALYRMPPKHAQRRIDELAELVGLSDARNTQMHFFSSGMKQRAAIARGLLTDPPILFLDEPTAMVDPIAAHDIRRMVADLVLDGTRTIFLTTNLMNEAEELCDRVALLRRGRMELMGGVDILRQKFQPHEKHVLLVGDTSASRILQLRGVPGICNVTYELRAADTFEITLEVAHGSRAIPACIAMLVEDSATVWQCSPEKLSLDEMFRMVFAEEGPEMPAAEGAAALRKSA